VFCFRAVFLEVKATREYHRIANWPVTEAIIHAASVYETRFSWGSRRFCPKIEYSYSVASHVYRSYNSVFDFVCWPNAYGFVAQHPTGTSIQIAYDPASPIITFIPSSVANPGYPWGDVIGGTLFLIMLILDLLFAGAIVRRGSLG
jgi:hypothetical protein